MILIIIALLVGAYFLFKAAKEYYDNLEPWRRELPADPDDVSGAIIDQDGSSRRRFG